MKKCIVWAILLSLSFLIVSTGCSSGTIRGNADGSGDAKTIEEALAMVPEGGTLLLGEGTLKHRI